MAIIDRKLYLKILRGSLDRHKLIKKYYNQFSNTVIIPLSEYKSSKDIQHEVEDLLSEKSLDMWKAVDGFGDKKWAFQIKGTSSENYCVVLYLSNAIDF